MRFGEIEIDETQDVACGKDSYMKPADLSNQCITDSASGLDATELGWVKYNCTDLLCKPLLYELYLSSGLCKFYKPSRSFLKY